jgi:hypothetical protein
MLLSVFRTFYFDLHVFLYSPADSIDFHYDISNKDFFKGSRRRKTKNSSGTPIQTLNRGTEW